MGDTPNLGLPYPELSDTADVPRDIKALADTLDALLGGGGGGGGSGVLPLANAPVLAVGMPGQIRAGRQLATADFTSMGLAVPVGLFNLSGLANLGSGGPLVNLGGVPFGVGINGLTTTAAVFAGSTGQALYISDTGAADPFRLRTGSWGCWARTAKRGVEQDLLTKWNDTGNLRSIALVIGAANTATLYTSIDGAAIATVAGISDVCDDRWHMIVATHDGTTQRLYVDAVPEMIASLAGPLFSVAAPLNLGARSADGASAGVAPAYARLDEAFVTPDVLTEEQVRLLYAAKLAHTLGVQPSGTRLSVHRRRKGSAWAVSDFTAQPVRLHNFTGGALTDQGSGGVALVANPGTGAIVDVAGADGTLGAAKSFGGAHQGLSATDAGLPGGLTPVSMGAWFKTTNSGTTIFLSYGTITTGERTLYIDTGGGGTFRFIDGPNNIAGPVACDGQWHLGVAVVDNTAGDGVKAKLYMDGRLVGGTTALAAATLAGAGHFRVGVRCDGASGPFTGQVDGAFICGYAMGAAEVAALYSKGSQELGASPKNAGDHVERIDATSVLFIADTLQSQHTVDLGVIA